MRYAEEDQRRKAAAPSAAASGEPPAEAGRDGRLPRRRNGRGRRARRAFFRLRFRGAGKLVSWLERHGEVPLPPYITRPTGEDAQRYQTIYAKYPGAVAAPTAGFHFDEATFAALAQRGVETAYLTLHVGAGTFQPVATEDLSQHRMHRESFAIRQATAERSRKTRARRPHRRRLARRRCARSNRRPAMTALRPGPRKPRCSSHPGTVFASSTCWSRISTCRARRC